MSTESKKHHYVPRSLLSYFTADTTCKTVAVFDKQSGRTYPSAVLDAGAENYFNTAIVNGRRVNFESVFQDIDDRHAVLLARLHKEHNTSCLTPKERQEFAVIVAVLMLRGSLTRLTLTSLPEQLREVFSVGGIDMSSELLPLMDDNAARIIALQMANESQSFAELLMGKDWTLLAPPDGDVLWIADNPVIRYNPFPYGDAGLASPGIQTYLPLGQGLLICFSCPSIAKKIEYQNPVFASELRGKSTRVLVSEEVKNFNRLQVRGAGRFVYGPSEDFSIARQMLADEPELRKARGMITMGEMGAPPRMPRMPKGTWLVLSGPKDHGMLPVASWESSTDGLVVRVPDNAVSSLRSAINDGPHELAQIVTDGVAEAGMREVILIASATDVHETTIRHADPSLRALMQTVNYRKF